MGPSPAEIDRIGPGMSKPQVREILGEPLKVFADAPQEESWMYRDVRHSGGYSYIYFDRAGSVTRVQGSMSFGLWS